MSAKAKKDMNCGEVRRSSRPGKKIMKKVCKNCKVEKDITEFYKAKTNKDGLNSLCKECYKQKGKDYIINNRDKRNRYMKEWRSKNKEYSKNSFKKWYDANKNTKNGYYEVNDEVIKKRKKVINRKYIKNNRQKLTAKEAKRRASKKQATPFWYEKEKIDILYKKCKDLEELTGLKYHVDHIIPLSHSNVCGLHVWNNLQILESSINITKSNKFIGE